jgi:predicted acyl esterase
MSEIRAGMRIDWDVPVPMDDGIILRADVYRPIAENRYPVILSYGPYGKWLTFQDGYPDQWRIMAKNHPDVTDGSTNRYQNLTPAAPAVLRGISTRGRQGRRGTFTIASNGAQGSRGAPARSGSTVFPILP